jgi:hypothetical protein
MLHHEQADIAFHAFGFATRVEAVNLFDLHWDAKTHVLLL